MGTAEPTTQVVIAWGAEQPVRLSDPDAVETLLRDLHGRFRQAGTPMLVAIDRAGVDENTSLAVGVGESLGLLGWIRTGRQREDLMSRGSRGEEGWVVFQSGLDLGEWPISALIDVEDAIVGARHYAATGRRPDNVDWQG